MKTLFKLTGIALLAFGLHNNITAQNTGIDSVKAGAAGRIGSAIDYFSLKDFNGIEAGGVYDIKFTPSEKNFEVWIEYKGEKREAVKAEVKNGILILSTTSECNKCAPIANISAPTLNSLKLHGSADFKSSKPIVGDKLEIKMSGAADADMEVKVKELYSDISGAAELKIKGEAETHTTDISGAGELKAINLHTQKTNAQVSGAGDARVNAVQDLNAKISGAGGISYKDEPANKNIDVSGAGTATKKEGSTTTIERPETDVNGNNDTTRFRFKDKKIIIIDEEDDEKSSKKESKPDTWHHWAGIDLGINGMINSANTTSLGAGYSFLEQNYGRSFNFKFNFWEKDFNLYEEKINIVTGLGIECANYSLKNKVILVPDANTISAMNTGIKYEKNKLRANYINVPLLLDFNTSNNQKKNWHFTTGVIAGYRYSSFTKQIYNIAGNDIKTKVKDDYNMNDFKFSAVLGIGYRNINLWANYGLNTLFTKSGNPDFYPVAVGITLVPFK